MPAHFQTFNFGFNIFITISTFMSVHPSSGMGVGGVPLSSFQFLQSYHKVWYVLRVKNMHSWSPPDPWGPRNEEKPSYINYKIRREEAKLHILILASVFHHLSSVGTKQLCVLAQIVCNCSHILNSIHEKGLTKRTMS